jgi:ATPase family AAA domain-containing protein 3A/B
MAAGASQQSVLEQARLSADKALADARAAEARASAAAAEESSAAHRAATAASEAAGAEAAMARAVVLREAAANEALAAKTAVKAAQARADEAGATERVRMAAIEEANLRLRNVTSTIALVSAEAERFRANASAWTAMRHRAEMDEARARAEEAAALARTQQAAAESRGARLASAAADAKADAEAKALKRVKLELEIARQKAATAKAEADAAAVQLQLAGTARLNTTQQVALAEAEAARAEASLLALEANTSLVQAETVNLAAAERHQAARESAERARLETERQVALEARETERVRAELQRNVTMESAAEQDRLARRRDAERVRIEREARMEAEQARRDTEIKLAELKTEGEAEVVKAKAEVDAKARIEQERANEDIHARERAEAAKAEHARWLAVVRESATLASDAGKAIVGPYLGRTVAAVLLFALAVYGSREALSYAGKAASARLGKPKLVRETSVGTTPVFDALDAAADVLSLGLTAWALPAGVTASLRGLGPASERLDSAFADVVLPPDLHKTVLGLARATRNAKANNAPLRHALFYGPPGTGKTMAAQRLARSVGLDYAVMAGGDVAPLAAEAVTELHRLFEWAKRSRRGLLLFIDEAEAFLGARDRAGGVSEHLRNVLSALLYQTGEQSAHYMLVLCTNRPEDLDAAVTDRIDQSLRFGLPDTPQRADMVWQYLSRHVLHRAEPEQVAKIFGAEWKTQQPKAMASAKTASASGLAAAGDSSRHAKGSEEAAGKAGSTSGSSATSSSSKTQAGSGFCASRQPPRISIAECVTPVKVASLARATDGFSGRQIGKLMLNVQGAVYASEDVKLRYSMIDAVLQQERRKHANKARAEEAARKEAEATGRHTAFLGGWD